MGNSNFDANLLDLVDFSRYFWTIRHLLDLVDFLRYFWALWRMFTQTCYIFSSPSRPKHSFIDLLVSFNVIEHVPGSGDFGLDFLKFLCQSNSTSNYFDPGHELLMQEEDLLSRSLRSCPNTLKRTSSGLLRFLRTSSAPFFHKIRYNIRLNFESLPQQKKRFRWVLDPQIITFLWQFSLFCCHYCRPCYGIYGEFWPFWILLFFCCTDHIASSFL